MPNKPYRLNTWVTFRSLWMTLIKFQIENKAMTWKKNPVKGNKCQIQTLDTFDWVTMLLCFWPVDSSVTVKMSMYCSHWWGTIVWCLIQQKSNSNDLYGDDGSIKCEREARCKPVGYKSEFKKMIFLTKL